MNTMTSAKSAARDAQNTKLVSSLRAAGHRFEVSIRRTSKGLFSVSLLIWHRNDTKRLMGTSAYLAQFFSADAARAYPAQVGS